MTTEGYRVHKALTKQPEFDLECARETFMEANKSFREASTSSSKDQTEPETDPSMLTTLLEQCVKLLRDNKVVKGLQEMITRCAGLGEWCIDQKLGKHALHTTREIQLTT